MPYAQLTITVPESVWMGELSRAHPETRFRVLAATANDSAGVARIELLGPDPQAVCAEIRPYESVVDVTVFERDADRYLVQIETTQPLLLTSLQSSGVPLNTPFEISDGEMVLETTIPQRHLSRLGETLDEFGICYTVERIQQEIEREPLLTERQRWLLEEAIDRGYYDTPRRTSLTGLADDLDLAKSTCSEVLHRAEENVLKDYIREDRASSSDVSMTAD